MKTEMREKVGELAKWGDVIFNTEIVAHGARVFILWM